MGVNRLVGSSGDATTSSSDSSGGGNAEGSGSDAVEGTRLKDGRVGAGGKHDPGDGSGKDRDPDDPDDDPADADSSGGASVDERHDFEFFGVAVG